MKVIWITGASSGIGEALAVEFSTKKAKLVLSARRKEELERVAAKLAMAESDILILPMDMQQFDTFETCFQTVLSKFGQLDVMVHNAGISQRETFLNTASQDIQRLMDTNFNSVVALTQIVLPHFISRKTGAFLVTSSVSGKVGTPYRTLYAASKHALQGFFDSLRAEVWNEGIQVTVACPGYINTPISYSAVGRDGKPYGKLDNNQAKGIAAEVCAKKMVSALETGRHEIIIAGFKESLGTLLKRFAPRLLWQFTKNYKLKSVEN